MVNADLSVILQSTAPMIRYYTNKKMSKPPTVTTVQAKYMYMEPTRESTHQFELAAEKITKDIDYTKTERSGSKRHLTLIYGCTSDMVALQTSLSTILNELMRKYDKKEPTFVLEEFSLSTFDKHYIAMSPKRNSIDWMFLCELKALLHMDPTVNRAHPDYVGDDKIEIGEGSLWFEELYDACASGESVEAAARRIAWPHISAFMIKDECTSDFHKEYKWVTKIPVNVTVNIENFVVAGKLGEYKVSINIPFGNNTHK